MIGIQPADMTYGEAMSEAVAAAGQVVADKIVQEMLPTVIYHRLI